MTSILSNLRPKNITLGRFAWLTGLYLLITLMVLGILFQDHVYDIGTAIGIDLEAILFVIALAFLAYLLQHALSQAYGGGRMADIIVSLPMLVVTGVAFLLWLDVPVVQGLVTTLASSIGLEVVFTPNSYKRTTMLLFLAVALWDVVIRDIFGKGRRSKTAAVAIDGFDPSKVDRKDWVSGKHGDLPDVAIETGPRSGEPEIVNIIKRRHVIEDYVQDPVSGRDIRIPFPPTPRSVIRMREIDGTANRLPPPNTDGGT